MTPSNAEKLLPLKPTWFHILLTLAEGPTHGYAIRRAVEQRTENQLKLWPTTLYGALSDLSEAALIEEADPDGGADDNLGKIQYCLTELGHEALTAEADRLDALVQATRAAQGLSTRTA